MITHVRSRRRIRRDDERGAGLVEYALLVALIAVVCIAAVTFVGTSGSAKLTKAGSDIQGGGGSTTTAPCFPGEYLNVEDGLCYPL